MISLCLVNYYGWFIHWLKSSVQVSGNENRNRKLPPIFQELLSTGRIKCSPFSNVIPKQCSHLGWNSSWTEAQEKTVPLSEGHTSPMSARLTRHRETRVPADHCTGMLQTTVFTRIHNLFLLFEAHSAFWMVVFPSPQSWKRRVSEATKGSQWPRKRQTLQNFKS